jgi:hypothetical protein
MTSRYLVHIKTEVEGVILLFTKHYIFGKNEEDAIYQAKKEAISRLASYFEYVSPKQSVVYCAKQKENLYEASS